jgi:hypothetical protein
VGAIRNMLDVAPTFVTNASPLIEMSHRANRNNAFEWIGMINHAGQIGGSFREAVPVHNTSIRFKSLKPLKEVRLMRAGVTLNFVEHNGWVEFTVPEVKDFEMVVCNYK